MSTANELDPEWVTLYELSEILDAKINEIRYNKINTLFPDTGIYRRELYPKHVAFMAAGAKYKQRAFIGANRVGKTVTAGTEMTFHLTGDYPEWWEGKRFTKPVHAWAAGISNESTKQIIQNELLGDIEDEELGTGLIPKSKIVKLMGKPGITGSVGVAYIRHKSGGLSKIELKSYEQGWKKFQGTKINVVWLDEEPVDDPKIYTECLTRTMDQFNPGIILCTFTPLSGYSTVVQDFLPDGTFPENGVDPNNKYKYVIGVTWDDCAHMSEEDKAEHLASYPVHERDARTKGIPSLGAGAIFPYAESDVTCRPFPIPDYWHKAYGLDVGWSRTAALWVAMDPAENKYYIYSEHYESHALPAVHATAIKARGHWIPGVIDTQAKEVSPTDGKCLWEEYVNEGLILEECVKAKEASILKVGQMLLSGQLKIFSTCANFFREYRKYRRNEDGKIVKKDDHLMDAFLYLIQACPYILASPPNEEELTRQREEHNRDTHTGY